jgi:HD superfamily phosphohydrolase
MISKTNGLEKWMQEGSNVMVYNAPPAVVESISFGESTGIVRYCHSRREMIEGVYWNEEFISVRTMHGEIVRFEPELNPDIQMFFTRKQSYRDRNTGYVVWDGDYEKAKFTKKSLLEWLSRHTDELEEDVRKSIREMKVTERLDTQSISLGDMERTTEEEEMKTSIPKNFKANVRIAENWLAEMHFKAYVARNVDDYGHVQKGYNIVLELENAREIKRGFMDFVLKQIPDEIPVYYGRLKVLNVKKNEEL